MGTLAVFMVRLGPFVSFLAFWMNIGLSGAKEEFTCQLLLGEHGCGNLSKCVHQEHICDGKDDCGNGIDEENCETDDGWGKEFVLKYGGKNMTDFARPQKSECWLVNIPAMCSCLWTQVSCENNKELVDLPPIPTNVTSLFLQNNSILLVADMFIDYPNLEYLNLEANAINNIPTHSFRGLRKLKTLYLSRNEIRTIDNGVFDDFESIEWFFLNENQIKFISPASLVNLRNIVWLDLSKNYLTSIENIHFSDNLTTTSLWFDFRSNKINSLTKRTTESLRGLSLTVLLLGNNKISKVEPGALSNDRVGNLLHLDLSSNILTTMPDNFFDGLTKLEVLDLSLNPIKLTSEAFAKLRNLQVLNLTGTRIENAISKDMFINQRKLNYLYFSQFRYCSYAPQVPYCFPKSDGISSLENLLKNNILRASVWIIGSLILVTNLSVLVGRVFLMKSEKKIHSMFITSLCGADLLIGIYLLSIASHDVAYRNKYNKFACEWMTSMGCAMTGVIGMAGSEVSVLFLTFISVERLLGIAHPYCYHAYQLKKRDAAIAIFLIWLAGGMLAIIPLMAHEVFGNFYGENGVCFPLHIQRPYADGWKYSAFIFLGVNFSSFLFILFAYTGMLISIMRTRSASKNVGDLSFTRRFFFIVFTDALCWLPICIIKIRALHGGTISDNLYAWITIFILPINSLLNPIIYTITTTKFLSHCKMKFIPEKVQDSNGPFRVAETERMNESI